MNDENNNKRKTKHFSRQFMRSQKQILSFLQWPFSLQVKAHTVVELKCHSHHISKTLRLKCQIFMLELNWTITNQTNDLKIGEKKEMITMWFWKPFSKIQTNIMMWITGNGKDELHFNIIVPFNRMTNKLIFPFSNYFGLRTDKCWMQR